MTTEHELKTWPWFWDAVESGYKTFEVRYKDRDFQVGDILVLRRFDPAKQEYDNDRAPLRRRVLFILPGGAHGLDLNYVIMALGDEDISLADKAAQIYGFVSMPDRATLTNTQHGIIARAYNALTEERQAARRERYSALSAYKAAVIDAARAVADEEMKISPDKAFGHYSAKKAKGIWVAAAARILSRIVAL